ncbi:hypothetical protein [Streptomyces sp. NPDC047009]|uniref:hypothetical protein n=1 Tax=Streptomyces sp. NPDC047009 TaxID=3154496 RepID=UPI00340808B1
MQLAPSALHATAETLGGYLGWTTNELIIDDIVSLDGPQERQIGMRLLGNGSSIQLWATGGTEPAQEPTEAIAPLPLGRRWHTSVHIGRLEADRDPATVLYNAITDRLLPVFDTKPLYVGHRPWDTPAELETPTQADTEATTPAAADQPAPEPQPEPQAPTEPTPQPTPEAAPEPAPKAAAKVIPMRSRRAKPAAETPAPAAAEPKPRAPRKRAAAKPAAAKADTPAGDAQPKPRAPRKRAAKPATS